MISPELLRRYPFFGFLTPEQQRAVAMIAEELIVPPGATVFHSGELANTFYLLLEGSVDLNYDVSDEMKTGRRARYYVGTVNPGEPLAISALVEPHVLTATAITSAASRLLAIDAAALRQLAEEDITLAYNVQRRIARAALDRLTATRVELLATSAVSGVTPATTLS